jgi:hypothetical protein
VKHLQFIGIAAIALLVLACSPREEPEGVIPQGYEDALDKAQGVQDKLQGAADAQLEAMEQADK